MDKAACFGDGHSQPSAICGEELPLPLNFIVLVLIRLTVSQIGDCRVELDLRRVKPVKFSACKMTSTSFVSSFFHRRGPSARSRIKVGLDGISESSKSSM